MNNSSTVPVAGVAERVLQIVAEESEQPRETIDRQSALGAALFDSLGVVELIMALEDEFEISIPDDDAEKIHTVGELIEAIEARLAPPRGAWLMPETILHARDVSFAYGDAAVLRGVGLSLAAGEVVTLLGPNGSGKSTLLRALLGQLPVTGDVRWQGRALGDWRRRDLARLVAYLPQSPAFEPEQTVRDVLRLGRAPYWGAFGVESPRDAAVVAEVAALLHLDDVLGRRADQLSGGQRQRVFVGRCLVQEPQALLLDEPGTFLDLRHGVELLQLLRKLAAGRGVGVLLASHDLNVAASLSDRLILLDGGTVAASGVPGDVLEPTLLERVYGVPMDRIDRGGGQAPAVLLRV